MVKTADGLFRVDAFRDNFIVGHRIVPVSSIVPALASGKSKCTGVHALSSIEENIPVSRAVRRVTNPLVGGTTYRWTPGSLRLDYHEPPTKYAQLDNLRSIDVFAGAGLMSHGSHMAGCTCVGAVEWDRHACETFAHNHPDAIVQEGDVADLLIDDGVLGKALAAGLHFNVLMGGSPCQPFSKMTHGARDDKVINTNPLQLFCDLVRKYKPAIVVHENVPDIMDPLPPYNSPYALLVKALIECGYAFEFKNVCMAEHGVPQMRQRNLCVAVRMDMNLQLPTFPEPTTKAHKTVPIRGFMRQMFPLAVQVAPSHLPYAPTAKEACGDLENIPVQSLEHQSTGNAVRKYTRRSINNNKRMRWVPYQKRARHGAGDVVHNHVAPRRPFESLATHDTQNEHAPFNTITTQSTQHAAGTRHYNKRMKRIFSLRELCRAQGVPDTFVLKGPYTAARRQVGNGVPSLYAKTLFAKITEYVCK